MKTRKRRRLRRRIYTIRNPFPTAAEIREQRELAELWEAMARFVRGKMRSEWTRVRYMERIRNRRRARSTTEKT